jgi:hypothetical protein
MLDLSTFLRDLDLVVFSLERSDHQSLFVAEGKLFLALTFNF